MKTSQKQSVWQTIDALLESMWQHSSARTGLADGSREYNYARSLFVREHREKIDHAAYVEAVAQAISAK